MSSLVIKPSDVPVNVSTTSVSMAAGSADSASSTPIGGSVGRIKAPPVCVDSSLKELAMTTEELSKSTFPAEEAVVPTTTSVCTRVVSSSDHAVAAAAVVHPVSSSSSTCTRESNDTYSGALSDGGMSTNSAHGKHHQQPSTPVPLLRAVSDRLNATVSLRKTSRQGRATQRWVADNNNNNSGTTQAEAGMIRLTTGCVPILRGGKILFVSSSRKPEWILPKGGWEQDETMEESAVRECFEEAGVLGVLGPKLEEIQYETRKAKKRRLQQEMERQQQDKKRSKQEATPPATEDLPQDNKDAATATTAVVSHEAMSRIREQSEKASSAGKQQGEETSSVASGASTSTYSQVRMTLFPLYVSTVADDWPEKGRFRRAVDIDEAIKMVESRPEFQKAILDVKQRGLHLLSEPHQQNR